MRWLIEKFLSLFRHRYNVGQHVYVWSPFAKDAGVIVDRDRQYPDYLVRMYSNVNGEPIWISEEDMCAVRQKPSRRAKIKRSIFFRTKR